MFVDVNGVESVKGDTYNVHFTFNENQYFGTGDYKYTNWSMLINMAGEPDVMNIGSEDDVPDHTDFSSYLESLVSIFWGNNYTYRDNLNIYELVVHICTAAAQEEYDKDQLVGDDVSRVLDL
jgi:hypothetical protein